jgi:hypothetical protein
MLSLILNDLIYILELEEFKTDPEVGQFETQNSRVTKNPFDWIVKGNARATVLNYFQKYPEKNGQKQKEVTFELVRIIEQATGQILTNESPILQGQPSQFKTYYNAITDYKKHQKTSQRNTKKKPKKYQKKPKN